MLLSGKPKPPGVNRSVWLSVSCQLPGTLEENRGRAEPIALSTGFENVSRTGSSGEIG